MQKRAFLIERIRDVLNKLDQLYADSFSLGLLVWILRFIMFRELLAFIVILLMCLLHDKSLVIVTPRYLAESVSLRLNTMKCILEQCGLFLIIYSDNITLVRVKRHQTLAFLGFKLGKVCLESIAV